MWHDRVLCVVCVTLYCPLICSEIRVLCPRWWRCVTQKNDVILSRSATISTAVSFNTGFFILTCRRKRQQRKEVCMLYFTHDVKMKGVSFTSLCSMTISPPMYNLLCFYCSGSCDPTSRVLHQNPKRAFQPVQNPARQTEERGKTGEYEGQRRKESERARILLILS